MLSFALSSGTFANPEGGQVVSGSANISANGKKLDVYQQSDRAVIDWRSFDIQIDEHTQFHQPSSSATALNRVNSADPSHILGQLSANGNVILVNPNGVFFGSGSKVDVNGLIATTSDITNADFMAGNMRFNIPGNPNAAVVNAGNISAKDAGLVALVAPNVANHGVITAKFGRVELASGDSFMVDLYGDGLYELKVSDKVLSQLVSNTGSIRAEGGTIAITAAAGKEIVNSLITIEGELRAPTIEEKGGKIIIAAEGSNAVQGNVEENKGKKQGSSTVLVGNAYIDASGRDEGEQGGEIEITGDNIGILQNTIIDASGHSPPVPTAKPDTNIPTSTSTMTADKEVRTEEEFLAHENRAGGSIKIGGDYLGTGDTATAEYVYVDQNSYIFNDAIESGDAGRTIIWSDHTTDFYGNVFARGGNEGGNGGFLETSGKKFLDAKGYADLTSIDGYKKGTYLLDPADITIYGNTSSVFNSPDLVGHWDFEEGSGTTAGDSSGNGNNGTLINGPIWSGVGAPTPQSNNNSLDFDGSDDLVSVGTLGGLGTQEKSLSFWLNPDSLANETRIISNSDDANFSIRFRNGRVEVWGNQWRNIIPTAGAAGTWTHYVFNFDGTGGVTGYKNSDVQLTNQVNENWSNIGIGDELNNFNGTHFDGLIDDVRIFDKTLSQNQINELNGTEFTVEGLEYMSNTADIILQADNSITLDLQGDSLTLIDDRSITLRTTNGDISTASTGSIITNRTTTGGNITFNAGGSGDINIDHALTLNAQNNGDITFTAGGDINTSSNLNIVSGIHNLGGGGSQPEPTPVEQVNLEIPNTVTITSQEPAFEIDSNFNYSINDIKDESFEQNIDSKSSPYNQENSRTQNNNSVNAVEKETTNDKTSEQKYIPKEELKSDKKYERVKSKSKTILHGLVEIHPKLVKLFNLGRKSKSFFD